MEPVTLNPTRRSRIIVNTKRFGGVALLLALLGYAYSSPSGVGVRALLGQASGKHAHAMNLYLDGEIGPAFEEFEPLVSVGYGPALETLCEFVVARPSARIGQAECLAAVKDSQSERLHHLTELSLTAQEWQFAEELINQRLKDGDATAHFDYAKFKVLSQPDAPGLVDVVEQVRLSSESGDPRGQYALIVLSLSQNANGLLDSAFARTLIRTPTLTAGDAYFELSKLMQTGTISSDLSYVEILRRSDQAGNQYAAGYLSQYFLNNLGLDPDSENASYWLEKAALNGDHVAQYNWALRLYERASSSNDMAAAVSFLNASAAAGFRPAITQLGVVFWKAPELAATTPEEGRQISLQWFEKAAELGDPNAMFNLGQVYLNTGRIDEGATLLASSAELGNTAAAELLSRILGG
jgi:TPR repeat protein